MIIQILRNIAPLLYFLKKKTFPVASPTLSALQFSAQRVFSLIDEVYSVNGAAALTQQYFSQSVGRHAVAVECSTAFISSTQLGSVLCIMRLKMHRLHPDLSLSGDSVYYCRASGRSAQQGRIEISHRL